VSFLSVEEAGSGGDEEKDDKADGGTEGKGKEEEDDKEGGGVQKTEGIEGQDKKDGESEGKQEAEPNKASSSNDSGPEEGEPGANAKDEGAKDSGGEKEAGGKKGKAVSVQIQICKVFSCPCERLGCLQRVTWISNWGILVPGIKGQRWAAIPTVYC